MSRNLRLYYALESILSLAGGIILPVYVVYFRYFEITLFEVALLAVIFEATIIIAEIPTGLFADRYGRKLSTIIGFALYTLSAWLFFSYPTLSGFIFAEIVFGLAETFISGALEALMVDSLGTEEKNKRLGKIFANRTIFKTSALLLGMLGGGFVAGLKLELLFLPLIFILTSGFVLAVLLKEERVIPSKPNKSNETKISLSTTVFKHPIITALFAVGLISNFAYEPVDQFWQVMFSEIKNISPGYFGFITAGGLLLVTIFAKSSARLYDKLSLYLGGLFCLMALAIYLSTLTSISPAIVGIVIYFATKELIRPAISTHLNRSYTKSNRATFLSTYNLVCSIGEVTAGLTAGYLAANFGVIVVFYISAIVALGVIVLFKLLIRRKVADISAT